jgi:DNA polymerase II large subunit
MASSKISRSDIWSRGNLKKRRNTAHNKPEKPVYGGEELNDVTSVITQDRLKKWNEIQGTFAGNVVDEIAQAEAAAVKEGEDIKAEADEVGDEVEALKSDAGEQEKPQDVLSLAPSRRSNATSKTYISKLEKQLEAEKQARLKLE